MIVLREQCSQIEVLMARRHANLAFMGGMWVFPGGALANADSSEAARDLTTNTDRCVHALRDLHGESLAAGLCVALAIAACRETFEETGVLLATRADATPCTPAQLSVMQSQQAAIARSPELFLSMLHEQDLRLDIAQLVYWAHWITPSSAARRFDTRFFVAAAPPSHVFAADTYETAECTWMTPADLLASAARRDMAIAQPTRYTLEDLRASIDAAGSLAELLRREANRAVPPIMPKMLQRGDQTLILLPWDDEYPTAPGDAISEQDRYASRLTTLPSRTVLDH